jgi:L-2-hydroxycarboxylate dehydrogenase (NAD+)
MDIAPTIAAFGRVRMKAALGEPTPVGWMIDRDGTSLTDAARASERWNRCDEYLILVHVF